MANILSKIPRTIKAVGFVSFLINTSTLMIFSITALYLHNKVGVGYAKIGFLDGAVEFFSYVMKMGSGIASDFIMNRKLIFLIGAFLLFIAKPIEAIATSYWAFFQAKILERLGNGLQAAPRDAIVGDWAPKDIKATCFGIRQSFAALGAVFGSFVAYFLLIQPGENYQFVFWMAAIPSFLAIIIIIFCVHDHSYKLSKEGKKQTCTIHHKKYRKITLKDVKGLGPKYWILIGVACTYMMSKVTESLIILHVTSTLGMKAWGGPLVMICYHLASSLVSLPAGMISDRLKSRETIFIAGIIVFIVSDILFIFGSSILVMIIALVLLGAYIGISQSIFPAKIIDIVPPDLKGTGLGIFNLACAISFLIGGSILGYISENNSPKTAFVVSSGLATISLFVLILSKKLNKKFK